MKPISFTGCNTIVAKDQKEYQPMPGMALNDKAGTRIFCWKLSLGERIKLVITGRLWQVMLTFNQPQHPQILTVDRPEVQTTDH